MSLYGAFDKTRHFAELADNSTDQHGNLLTPTERRDTALQNLTGSTTLTAAEVLTLEGVGAGLVGGRMTFAAQTVTIATLDLAVEIGGTSAKVGDSKGFTVGTDGTMTATFSGTRLCRIQAIVEVESADNTTTNAALCIILNGAEVAGTDTAEQDTDTDLNPKLFEVDDTMLISNGDIVEIGLINGTDTANLVTIVAKDRTGDIANQAPASGWFTISG